MNHQVVIIGADHHNTLGVVESLAEKGIKPFVLIYEKSTNSFVLHSKHVAGGWICQTEEDAVKTLRKNFSDSTNKAVMIATNDEVAGLVDRNHAILEEYFFLPIATPAGQLEQMMKKEWMTRLAQQVGLNVPTSWMMTNGKIPDDITFPIITKAPSSVIGGKGDIKICHTRQELESFIITNDYKQLQIQHFVNKAFEFQLLGCSLNSGEEVLIPGRTHIDRPNNIDNTFFLRFDKYEEEFNDTVAKAVEFVKRTKYSGPFSIEFLRDKNGKNYFTEMNFRNDGNAYCVTKAGTNIPYIIYLYLTGGDYKEELNQSTVETTYLMPEIYYTMRLIKREFSIKEWWRNMRRADCFTTYFRHDAKPFLYALLLKAKKNFH